MEQTIKLTFSSHLENLPLIAQATRGICSIMVKDEWLLYQLELCVVEVVSNIIIHAYKRNTGNLVELEMNLSPNYIAFKFYDSGIKNTYPCRNNLEMDSQDIENLPESGRGLGIIHQIMDDIEFGEEQGKNVILLKKRLG